MTPEEIAFAAGLFEGEGHPRRSSKNSTRIEISMTDKEPLEKLQFLLPQSHLNGPYYKQGYKPKWRWHLYGKHAKDFLVSIYPWMSPRRQKQIANAIEYRKKQAKTAEGREGPSDLQVPPLTNQCLL